MNASIYAGNLQRTGEYQTRGLRTLQGVRWGFQAQGHIHFPPLVAHGMVYVGSNDGCFYALGTHTGALQWRFETECASLPEWEEDLMDAWEYTGVTSVQLTETTAFFGTANGIIYGLDLETGQPTWQLLDEQDKKYLKEIFHVIVVDDLLLFWSEFGISAVNVSTKERLWLAEGTSINLTEPLSRCPTVADQMPYFTRVVSQSEDTVLSAYDLSTREVVWDDDTRADFDEQLDPHGYIHHSEGVIPVVNGTAYFVARTPTEIECEDGEGYYMGATCLVAVDARTGKLQWFFVLEPDWMDGGYTALANNLVYVVQMSGNIFAIDLTTHEARWTRQLEGDEDEKRYAPPSLADGVLYLPRRDGLLTALDALTGQDLWTVQLDGEITTPCTIADGVVYVAAGASVYALH